MHPAARSSHALRRSARMTRSLAQAFIDGVLLLDAASGEWLAPPLRVPIAAPDVVSQLAFSADGSRLLARTHFGRWLWWRLDPDARDNALIAQEAQLLSPAQESLSVATSREERRTLRRLDPEPRGSLHRHSLPAAAWRPHHPHCRAILDPGAPARPGAHAAFNRGTARFRQRSLSPTCVACHLACSASMAWISTCARR